MAPNVSARTERERKLKSLISFASALSSRLNAPRDDRETLQADLQGHIHTFPLLPSPTVAARQDELDRAGTELWNLSTKLWRKEAESIGGTETDITQKKRTLCLVRVFAFLLLDTAAGQAIKARERKHCIRLLRVALKAARVCIDNTDLASATKVLERAADYQEALAAESNSDSSARVQDDGILRLDYFIVRTALAWRQDRMDTAEHMFAKIKQMTSSMDSSTAESLADLVFVLGKDLLGKRHHELAIRWLERGYDILGDQELETLSPEAGELRQGTMQTIVQAYMKLKTPEAKSKAWDMLKLLEIDYGEKMAVQLLKLELLSAAESMDTTQFYATLVRMIRSIVLTETTFKTIMYHIHQLKDNSPMTACKILDEFIDARLLREEKQCWVEKAVVTRIWADTTGSVAEPPFESLKNLFENVFRNTKHPFSAPATHAAQTLLWKRVEAAYALGQFMLAESWCQICLHPLFDKAGELNKSKMARKIILCALSRQDYAVAREAFARISDTGKDESITRYLMYKVALHERDRDLAAKCLDIVCQKSRKDATLLYACILEAQSIGDKRQTIIALERVLEKYDYSAPAGVHLPALLRCTIRSLTSELVKDGQLCPDIIEEMYTVFEGACVQAKRSRRRPPTPTHDLFTPSEFRWFSKNAYNLALKYCAEMHPGALVRLLNVCAEFIKLMKEESAPDEDELSLRLMFCDFLSCCAFTILARTEDNIHDNLQHYLQVRKHSQEFRRAADQELRSGKRATSAQADVIAKYFQVIKMELEAALKLESWDSLDELFEACWKYENPKHLETLADLVLVIHSCMVKANIDRRYQDRVLKALQKIITLTWRHSNNDIVKISRWIRCLFQLALTFDESISLECIDHATQIAAARQGEINHYPSAELEWLATTSFNHAVDYYLREEEERCKTWATKSMNLAQWAEDGGELRDMLVGKYRGLVWNE